MVATKKQRAGIARACVGMILVAGTVFFFARCTGRVAQPDGDDGLLAKLDTIQEMIQTDRVMAKRMLDSAFRQCRDSADYYRVYNVKMQYHSSGFEYDSLLKMMPVLSNYLRTLPAGPETARQQAALYNFKGVYWEQVANHFDSAGYYFRKAYETVQQANVRTKMPDILINLADVNARAGKYVDGIYFFRKALTVADSLGMGKEIHFPVYMGLGQAYFMGLRSFDLSDKYFRMAEQELGRRNLNEQFVFCNNRGNFYFFKEDYAKAIPWFRRAKAIAEQRKVDFNIQLCNGNMGDVFLHLKMADSAALYLNKSYIFFKDSKNQPVINYLSNALMGLAVLKKNVPEARRYMGLYVDEGYIEPEFRVLRYANLQDYYELCGDFRQAYKMKQLETQLTDSLRPEWVNARIEEIDMRYKEDTVVLRSKMMIADQNSQIKILRLTNRVWIILIVAAMLIALFTWLALKRRRQAELQKHINTVSAFRLQNIRNRISPHFIFNVLNRQINTGKQDSNEMVSLVNLLRQSLQMTESIAIAVADEIRFARSYVELESASLGADFRVEWNLELENDSWLVPAMIVQIPVENAIKHALRPKEGPKLLRIVAKESPGLLTITVEDNGTGLAEPSPNRGTGTGLRVVYQTLDILNAGKPEKISFAIDRNGDPQYSGTIVRIGIPTGFNFQIL